jgi:hypothetical protein
MIIYCFLIEFGSHYFKVVNRCIPLTVAIRLFLQISIRLAAPIVSPTSIGLPEVAPNGLGYLRWGGGGEAVQLEK